MKKFLKIKWISLIFIVVFITYVFIQFSRGIVFEPLVYVQQEIPIKDKTALIVLTGLGNSEVGQRAAQSFYPDLGYDVFIPDYISREGFHENIENFKQLIKEHRLKEYKEVYVFAFLVGGWTLNQYLETHKFQNLTKIIYDRSPLQEQAPRMVLDHYPRFLLRLRYGLILEQFRDSPYTLLAKGDREIGLIIESKATPLVKAFRDKLTPISAEGWLPQAFGQEYDDHIYVFLDHDEIYYKYDELGDDLISFFETGHFLESSSRKPIERDSFE